MECGYISLFFVATPWCVDSGRSGLLNRPVGCRSRGVCLRKGHAKNAPKRGHPRGPARAQHAAVVSKRHAHNVCSTAALGLPGEERPAEPRGEAPPEGSPAPPGRQQALLPGSGAPVSRTLRALPPHARLLSRPGRSAAGVLPVHARTRGARVSRRPAPPPRPRARAAPPCECRRRRLPRLESACWLSAKEGGGKREEGGQEGRLGLRCVGPRETRIARPREGRPGRGRCKPRAEAERGSCRVSAARRAHSAWRRGLEDEFPGVRVSWFDRRVRIRVGRGQPRRGGQRGLRADFRRGPGMCWRPERWAARFGRPAKSLKPGLCQAAADWAPLPRAPTPGRSPPQTPAPGRRTSGLGGRPVSQPLLCSPPPGFRPSLGRRCGRKPPPRTLLESLNGKGAHLPRLGAARLILAMCLYTLLQKRKTVCFVGW